MIVSQDASGAQKLCCATNWATGWDKLLKAFLKALNKNIIIVDDFICQK